jgi:ApbE superfamily uncharacterized protein (UPF0280 family)
MKYGERFYRDFSDSTRWTSFCVKVESTDLFIRAKGDFTERVKKTVIRLRDEIQRHISENQIFLTSYKPLEQRECSSTIVNRMYHTSKVAGVGPMAAIAGVIAESVGVELSECSEEVIVENGGDIWLKLQEPVTISIFAGSSPFSGKIALKIDPERTPLGICTSSGRLGHSFSFGNADAATIISEDAALADATATETGNLVKGESDLKRAVDYAMSIDGVIGSLVIYRDKMIIKGDVEIVPL